jgi:hypothetical protein
MKEKKTDSEPKLLRITDMEPVQGEAFVVCFGTSLIGFDWERLRDKFTIGVNDTVRYIPNLDIHLFSDPDLWFSRYSKFKYRRDQPQADLVCRDKTVLEISWRWDNIPLEQCFGFKKTKWTTYERITPDNWRLFMAATVVCPAVQLAWKLGCKKIYVLGFDAYDKKDGGRRITYADGTTQAEKKRNLLSDKGGIVIREKHKLWASQAERMTDELIHKYSPEVEIYNLSPRSTVTCWEKVDPETVL